MKRKLAERLISNVLATYCGGKSPSEVDEINKAWSTIKKGTYQVRTKGDGDFEYFIVPPMEDEHTHNYDPSNVTEAHECARELGGWVVKIIEERL